MVCFGEIMIRMYNRSQKVCPINFSEHERYHIHPLASTSKSQYNMRGKDSSEVFRAQILCLRDVGLSYKEIAAKLGCTAGQIQSAIRRNKSGIQAATQNRVGRPLKISQRGARALAREATKNRRTSNRALARKSGSGSANTIRTTLLRMGVKKYKAIKKPGLRPSNRAARLKFAREHRAWTVEDWRKVVWTDETSVSTAGNSATVWVFRKPGERLHPSCVIPTYKSGHVTVMMWGAFQGNKRGPLARCPDGRINSEKYIELLTEKGLPWFRTLGEGALWMQDNATVHTSRRTTRFLRDNGLEPIKWPPQSPDLNPIENLWFVLKAKLQKKFPHMSTLPGGPAAVKDTLEGFLEQTWAEIGEDLLEKYVSSMPARMAAVLRAKGSWTKY